MDALLVSLLLWLNGHGFASRTGLPQIHRASSAQTHGYVAWYHDGIVDLSERFDYDGLLDDPARQRGKLARSALLHELTHFCQAQREGANASRSERAWMEREDEAYRLQTAFLREVGSSTVLLWRRDHEG